VPSSAFWHTTRYSGTDVKLRDFFWMFVVIIAVLAFLFITSLINNMVQGHH
jgi:uncharacterized BrkB/YihY/UPF0761 family membrane protein